MLGPIVTIHGSATKGITKRTPRQEAALRVRIMTGRHLEDAHRKLIDEIGQERADTLGPIDITRNALRSMTERIGRAYLTPPLVSGLSEEFARLLGDMSASTTVERYAAAGGRPMPTRMATASEEALEFRLACNFVGTLIGWSARSARPYLEKVNPDDLKVVYASDDPLAPTVIHHYRRRLIDGQDCETTDTYDLTDVDRPIYTIDAGGQDITEDVMSGAEGWDGEWSDLWRYQDGRPFHRIIISGNPREPYRNVELVEGTLKLCMFYTHLGAGIRDAGHPARNAIGLQLVGRESSEENEATGTPAGPEYIHRWEHIDPERPGTLYQFGPGFDPEITGKAIRNYELQLYSALGIPVDFEGTGGDPTEQERQAMIELVATTYPACRGHDALVFRRAAAIHNRATSLVDGIEPTDFPEAPLPVLYREEVTQALGADTDTEPTDTPEEE